MRNMLSKREEKRVEANFDNTREAWNLLDLIDAEFRGDPMSTQCFDLRIVQRVHECVAKRREYERGSPFAESDASPSRGE